MKNILIIAHKYLPQPDDDLVFYLNQKKFSNVLHIKHSFPDANDRRSSYAWYKNGKIYRETSSTDFRDWAETLIYIKELFFTIVWGTMSGLKWDYCIGMDGFCVNLGLILKFLKKTKTVIYWNTDFVPEGRFSNRWKNSTYHTINKLACLHADQMWDLSPRMREAREKFLGVKKYNYKSYKVVPYGAWNDRIKKYTYNECEKSTIVFMGHLLPKQGVDLVINKIPEIVKVFPKLQFKIIGDGRHKDKLIALAENLGVKRYCKFMGRLRNEEMEKEIARSCVAIAPYVKALDSWTYYADPGKVKTYLACGVPVLLTDVPWNAKDIEENKCGEIINDDGTDLVLKLKKLTTPKINQEYRVNAVKYSQYFNYTKIFANLKLS